MQEISNVAIAVLGLGLTLITVFIFLILAGQQFNLEKMLRNCFMGTFYLVVLIAITFCREDSHWAEASANDVNIRVWASDKKDYKSDIGVHLGLRGINITLKVKDTPQCSFNERFEWAWGTKNSMEDGSNPYKRTLKCAVRKGLPLPIQDLAESFETYGTLGPASAGLGVHEAGFYTDLFLTVSLIAWIIAGLLPPLSLYASLYASCVSCLSMTLSLILYIVIFYSSGVVKKSRRYFQSANEDSKVEFFLIFSWGFYINLVMCPLSATLCFFLRKYAYAIRMKEAQKLQQEIEEIKEQRNKNNSDRNGPRRENSRSSIKKMFKRRLSSRSISESLCKDILGAGVTAVPQSEVLQTMTAESNSTIYKNNSTDEVQDRRISMQAENVRQCDLNYTDPDSTMVYGIATDPNSMALTNRGRGDVMGRDQLDKMGEICDDPLAGIQ